MEKIEIIPAIDLIEGKCVRLSKGDYASRKIYSEDPVDMARKYQDIGIERLHLVDLDGARKDTVQNIKVLDAIASKTILKVDFSGGLKSREAVARAFDYGAAFVVLGSLAHGNQELCEAIMTAYGNDKVIIGADVRDRMIAIRGWKEQTGTSIDELIRSYGGKIRHMVCTDISRDGMFSGPSTDLYMDLLKQYPDIHLIASGGIASMREVHGLAEKGIRSVIIGKAIYENRIELKEIENYIKQ